MNKPRHKNTPGKWNVMMAVQAGICAFQNMTDTAISREIGISTKIFQQWTKKKSLFRRALEMGRNKRYTDPQEFPDYVANRLSRKARKVWDDIMFWEDNDKIGADRIDELMKGQSLKMRQRLWLFAYTQSKFTKSAASRRTGIDVKTVNRWLETASFREMYKEIEEIKKDFFEEALVDLAANRDSAIVMFANRTKNRDRGYGEKLEVAHSGTVDHIHSFNIDKLLAHLSVAAKAELVEAMDKLELEAPKEDKAIDVEVEEKEIEE